MLSSFRFRNKRGPSSGGVGSMSGSPMHLRDRERDREAFFPMWGWGGKSKRGSTPLLLEISEETSLIAAALVAVTTLFVTRATWFPASFVESMIAGPPCELPLSFNSRGAVEGPWLNDSWQQTPSSSSPTFGGGGEGGGGGTMGIKYLLSLGKLIATSTGGDDGQVKAEHLTQGIEGFQDTASPVTLAFARLAERYLATWLSIDGIQQGLGHKGLIKNISLHSMANNSKLAPCATHVRIIGGRVYFRYGSFLQSSRKLRRINLMIRAIQEAVNRFHLEGLKAELFLNACDEPQSYDNSLSSGKSGFPLFSTQLTSGSSDILCPDPMDLLRVARATINPSTSPWGHRQGRAVWRGEGAEYPLKLTNWASSFRMRLHRMSDVRPDLLDARITMWGPYDRDEAKNALVRSGIALGTPMSLFYQLDEFKYTLVVDERVGTRDMCAALIGPQAIIRHASGFSQWFEPLLLPGVHYVGVRHSLADLFEAEEWMRANDGAVQRMVKNANEISPLMCSQHGQVHFWAVLLAKYSARAMEDPEAVKEPKVCPGGKAITSATWANEKSSPTCKHPSGDPCTDFCVQGKTEDDWTWLDSDAVSDLAKILTL